MWLSNFEAGEISSMIKEQFNRLFRINDDLIKVIQKLKEENKFLKIKIKNLEGGIDYHLKENFKLSDKLGLINIDDPNM